MLLIYINKKNKEYYKRKHIHNTYYVLESKVLSSDRFSNIYASISYAEYSFLSFIRNRLLTKTQGKLSSFEKNTRISRNLDSLKF